jgi:hypothetical protein
MKRLLLLLPGLLGGVACASSGATSSSLPAWSEYLGRYEFVTVSEGQQLEGYLVIHSPEEFSVRYMLSPGAGNTCTRITEGEGLELGGRARLRGNQLTLTCRGLSLVIRRDVDGLEGHASWRIAEQAGTVCVRYSIRGCVVYAPVDQTVHPSSLKLTRMSDQE